MQIQQGQSYRIPVQLQAIGNLCKVIIAVLLEVELMEIAGLPAIGFWIGLLDQR
jgi:hypothetical protein